MDGSKILANDGLLAGGERISVTHQNSTDLQLAITTDVIKVSDGVIAAEDAAAAGPPPLDWRQLSR